MCHDLICPKCGSGNIIPDRFSDTGERCMMCGTQKGFIERVMPEQGQLNLDGPTFTAEQQAVWNCIRDRRGRGNEILGTEISRITGIDYTRVRAVIAELINHKGRNIGSNSRGYYVPVTPDEIREATRSLRHRGIMILWRASKLTGNSLEEVFHQGRIEFDPQKEAANQ